MSPLQKYLWMLVLINAMEIGFVFRVCDWVVLYISRPGMTSMSLHILTHNGTAPVSVTDPILGAPITVLVVIQSHVGANLIMVHDIDTFRNFVWLIFEGII